MVDIGPGREKLVLCENKIEGHYCILCIVYTILYYTILYYTILYVSKYNILVASVNNNNL